MSGLVPLFTDFESASAANAHRATTPEMEWKPPTRGRDSASLEQNGMRALRDLGILSTVRSTTRGRECPAAIKEAQRLLLEVHPPTAALQAIHNYKEERSRGHSLSHRNHAGEVEHVDRNGTRSSRAGAILRNLAMGCDHHSCCDDAARKRYIPYQLPAAGHG